MAGGEWAFWACSEYCGALPDGQVKPADRSKHKHWRVDAGGRVHLASPRNGWLSLRVVAAGKGQCAVRCRMDGDGIAADLYREFYHRMAAGEQPFLADALVPIAEGAKLAVPDPEQNAPNQTAQSVWVDLFVARDAKVGTHTGKLVLAAGGAELAIDLAVDVLELVYPDEDCIVLDHNSYGSKWLVDRFSKTVPQRSGPEQDAAIVALLHAYHKMCFEHRGLLHNLGFGHSGTTTRLFAPKAVGAGRTRHLADWGTFDAHYGPLLDGSAFAACRRKAAPVYATYTPITPAWPADYTGWGHKGFEIEFTNCLRDFDAHFRENGWTKTLVEFFFNHKKRYRYFDWDGDEPRYPRDDVYYRQFNELLRRSVARSPVQWRFRCDASWMQAYHWNSLAGIVDFWVCGGFSRWYEKEVHEGPMARGEVVWTYSGGSTVADASSDIIQYAYKTWIRDFTGNCNWLTTNPGAEPWTNNDGARTGMFYPGERFGIAGPVANIRLKVQRNAMQDLNLLQVVADARGKAKVKADLVPTIPIRLWDAKPRGVRELPPWEWTKSNLESDIEPNELKAEPVDPLWWQAVRQYAVANAQEVRRG